MSVCRRYNIDIASVQAFATATFCLSIWRADCGGLANIGLPDRAVSQKKGDPEEPPHIAYRLDIRLATTRCRKASEPRKHKTARRRTWDLWHVMGRAHRDGGKLEADVHKGRTVVVVFFGDEFAFKDVSEFERAPTTKLLAGAAGSTKPKYALP